MGRYRIRTIKPESWQDERVGDLSHGARLLWIGLITMADDEGRVRELPMLISGQVFPYDDVTPAKLQRWLEEIAAAGMIVRYEVGGKRYIAFPTWAQHQRVDRPSPSELPAPPDSSNSSANGSSNSSTNGSGSDREAVLESIDDRSIPPRVRASRSDPDPDPRSVNDKGGSRRARRANKHVDQSQPPSSLPEELRPIGERVLPLLVAVQTERGGDLPTLRGVGLAIARYPDRDHLKVARDLQHWALAGPGQHKPVGDWARTYATFLGNAPAGSPTRPGARPGESKRDRVIAERGDYLRYYDNEGRAA